MEIAGKGLAESAPVYPSASSCALEFLLDLPERASLIVADHPCASHQWACLQPRVSYFLMTAHERSESVACRNRVRTIRPIARRPEWIRVLPLQPASPMPLRHHQRPSGTVKPSIP